MAVELTRKPVMNTPAWHGYMAVIFFVSEYFSARPPHASRHRPKINCMISVTVSSIIYFARVPPVKLDTVSLTMNKMGPSRHTTLNQH